jgi:hypothetical protein
MFLLETPDGQTPHGTRRRLGKNNIKMDLQDIGLRLGLDFSGSGQEQVAGSCK